VLCPGLSEADLSSPLNYGTPSSLSSIRTPRSTVRGTPARNRPDIRPDRHLRTVNLNSDPVSVKALCSHSYYRSKRYFPLLVVQEGFALWGNALTTALFHDHNWTIPFVSLRSLRFSPIFRLCGVVVNLTDLGCFKNSALADQHEFLTRHFTTVLKTSYINSGDKFTVTVFDNKHKSIKNL